jgi:hypothetical protein
MAAQQLPKYEHEHEVKWRNIDLQLNHIGFWVKWQRDFVMDSHKYAIGLKGEKQPMGIYNDEDTATAMAKMLWTNAKDGD